MMRFKGLCRIALVAVLLVATVAIVYQVGNRTVSRPTNIDVDQITGPDDEILWTGGACVDLQVSTAWWGWRTIATGSIDGHAGTAEWSATGSWYFLTGGLTQSPCPAVLWNQVPIQLPHSSPSGVYRICDNSGNCTTVDLPA